MRNKEIFFLLQRLLDKFSIKENSLPTDLKKWRSFLAYINDSFHDFDQERYLLERSMKLSSAEYLEVTDRFEEAEMIAHIGHWLYRPDQDKIFWSKASYAIFGIYEGTVLPGFMESLDFIYDEDRPKIKELVDLAITEGKEFAIETRIYFQIDHSIRWILIKCKLKETGIDNNAPQDKKFYLSGIFMDIDQQKKNEKKLKKLNTQLAELSRRAGMSEVAESVLHNIGNVLNSVGISLAVIHEKMTTDQSLKLKEVANLIEVGVAKKDNTFSDEKGLAIAKYLNDLSQILLEKQQNIGDELDKLEKHFQHISSIVLMQRDFSGFSGLTEKIKVVDLLEQAKQLSYETSMENMIQITQYCEFNDDILIDKMKALQILINLLRNATQAVLMCKTQAVKEISITTQQSAEEGFFDITVSDNGVGIEKEAMNKVFRMNYTTKNEGHGIGLHTSVIAAEKMGGKLTVKSPGQNQGAVFTLTLPISAVKLN